MGPRRVKRLHADVGFLARFVGKQGVVVRGSGGGGAAEGGGGEGEGRKRWIVLL